MRTLLVPAAGRSSRYPDLRPKWVLTHPTGKLMIEMVLEAMDYRQFDRTVITVIREHCELHHVDVILRQIFGNSIDILVLENETSSAAETVFQSITQAEIEGDVIIKDSDCVVRSSVPVRSNFIVGLSIHENSPVDRIQSKSFIVKDDNDVILDIVEKDVVSNFICVGVYAADAGQFASAYADIRSSDIFHRVGELYVSHVMSYLMLQKKVLFHYIEADDFVDWGTLEDWYKEIGRHKTYVFDIDGVILKNCGKYGEKNWANTFEPIAENVRVLKRLSDEGHEIIFMTSRTEEFLAEFRQFLVEQGIRCKTIVSGCHHGKRIIINDFAASNPYPSCEAVAIRRNDLLEYYLP
jgi:ribonucleotide monophosphatase NagD (HAD superfamily)